MSAVATSVAARGDIRLASVADVAIEAVDLVKRYDSHAAVDGLSFNAQRAAVTALLGPNGAGKTTTIEICEGFRSADGGSARVLDLDPAREAARLKPRIGVMLQSGGIPPASRAGEMLRLVASFYRQPIDPDTLLGRLGLRESARRPYRRLSGGQQQRLSLAMAVVGRPELVFLDEPTAGLDPQARRGTWDLIEDLRADGVAVVVTTHYMEEAERLADHVVIVDHGRVVAADSPTVLTAGSAQRQLRFSADPGLDLDDLLPALPPGSAVKEASAGSYIVEGDVDPGMLATVTSWCAARDVLVTDLHVGSRSLEDVFLDMTGRELR